MKPEKIQRDIEFRHARAAARDINPGQVSRLRDPEPGRGGPHWYQGMAGSSAMTYRNRVILVWSLTLTLLTLGVIGGFMISWLRSHRSPQSAKSAAEEHVRIVSQFISPGEDEALTMVKGALATRDPAKVASFFHPGSFSPEEVVEFLAGSEARDGRIERYDWLSSMDVDGLLMDGVLVSYAGRESPGERLAFLTPGDTGVWKVDFDAFARTSRPPWKDLLERRANHAQVRVFMIKDAYYNGPFQDESRWVCYGMLSPESKALLPEGQELLCGYCRVGSPQAKALERIFAEGGGIVANRSHTIRTTLEIRRTEGAESRQFEITRVWAQDWVLPPIPFDEKYK